VFVVGSLIRSRRMPPGTGPEELIGATGKARSDLDPEGKVFVDGAIWTAVSVGDDPVRAGDMVIVEARDGLMLKVRRAEGYEAEPIYRTRRPSATEGDASHG